MTQQVMQIFDIHNGMSRSSNDESVEPEDETLIVNLLACFYLCLKSEHRINEMRFDTFIQLCARLHSFRVLEKFVKPLTNCPLEYFGSAEDARKIYVLCE